MNSSVVSKHFYRICKGRGIENKIVPVFVISPLQQQGCYNSTRILTQNLRDYSSNEDTNKKFQNYGRMIVNTVDKFDTYREDYWDFIELKSIVKDVQMNNITSLNLYSHSPNSYCGSSIPLLLPSILPNLLELNNSNTSINGFFIKNFADNCPLLEMVISNNTVTFLTMNCRYFESCNNLKELYLDSSSLKYVDQAEYSNFTNDHPTIFLFHCCKSFERISILNTYVEDIYGRNPRKISQNILIEFIRNAPPSLCWFRSDLSIKNMNMLRSERPGIELLN